MWSKMAANCRRISVSHLPFCCLSLFLCSLFMAIAALIMQCAMWLGNGNWLNDAAIVTILPFTVGNVHATLPHATATLPACLLHGASIKDSIKFNWKCPREAADCNFNWQLQQLHRRTEQGADWEREGGERGKHCSSKITSLIWLQIACCSLCVLSVSLFVLAVLTANRKINSKLCAAATAATERGGQGRVGHYLILISSQMRRHCICQQQCHRNPFVLCPIQMANQSVKAKSFLQN